MTRLSKHIISSTLATLFLGLGIQPAHPCTLFAAAGGRVEGGGTLICKNRDRAPRRSALKMFKVPGELKFLGLVDASSREQPAVAGVNEKGLVVVDATASSLPARDRRGDAASLTEKALAACASVDAALARKDIWARHPAFHLLADGKKIAIVEAAPRGQVAVMVRDQGALCHTNHYLDGKLAGANRLLKESSWVRQARIWELLAGHRAPLNLEDFLNFSQDQDDGPDNSIWRTGGKPRATRTLATWIVAHPQGQAPRLFVKIANPGEPEEIREIQLDTAFWQGRRIEY
ncbi:MAG: hypothetical protein FJ126_14180 [Deltaproteobacteria bacterium]|nr:hypothetical protein [Deltaproteobacteria bacterium]